MSKRRNRNPEVRALCVTSFQLFLLAACGDAPPPPAPPGPAWFEEVASSRGIDFTWRSGHEGRHYMPEAIGGGAALFDMDGDGDLDAYLVQGGSVTRPLERSPANRLLENDGRGAFRDVTEGSGTGHDGYGMGVACGDYDNDEDVDLYVTNLGANVLFRNDGAGRFTDVTAGAGVGHEGWGTSAVFLDYDRDGDLDLFVLNYIHWSAPTEIDCYNDAGAPDYCLPGNYGAPARDVLYRNDGDGTFADVSDAAGMTAAAGTGLGVVSGDLDGNGCPDLFVANDGMPDHLWFNRGNGTFIEVGMSFGTALDQEGKAKAGMGVTAADVDGDLDLDVLVVNLHRESDSLYLNESKYFVDGTIGAGLGAVTRGFTRFGVGFVDFDHDGYLDLYEANGRVQARLDGPADDPYAEPNMLLRGGPGPRFEPVGPRGGTRETLVHASRAAAFGDVDGDGGVDLLVVNRDGPAYLLRNVVAERGRWVMLRVLEEHGRDAHGATVTVQAGEATYRRDVGPASSYLASNDPRVHVGLGDARTVDAVRVRWRDDTVERFGPLPADAVHTIRRGEGTVTPSP